MVAKNPKSDSYDCDVAIIGGGPGGTTTGTLLKKYNPKLRVVILEKEKFPRDHIGESQLPPISAILNEMGCWDQIERAGFPVKIGATYTWGKTVEPWIFEFIPVAQVPKDVERPGRYEGWRLSTAFQVDRAIYDKVLLDHARKMECGVREEVAVRKVHHADDAIEHLELSNGASIRARHYVDASGNAAILRRALGVRCDIPTLLRNVAFWDYWENPKWALESDVKATRVHIRSVPYGWLWFIRLSPTRTSVGLVTPADHYKKCGKKGHDLYRDALRDEPTIAEKLVGATPRGTTEGTTDWSFVVERTYGKNWYLVGECAGFADPILAAGLTLTHAGARELAYTILELERGEHPRGWLLDRYHDLQVRRVRQHLRFAEFWYSANGIFEDIRENCTRIAEDAGLKLNSAQAFQWLSQGGLSDDIQGQAGIGGLDLTGVKQVMMRMGENEIPWTIDGKTHFELNLANAKEGYVGVPESGRIVRAKSWTRNKHTIAEAGLQGLLLAGLRQTDEAGKLLAFLRTQLSRVHKPDQAMLAVNQAMQVLETMANDHWVLCRIKKGAAALNVSTPFEGAQIHSDRGEARL